MIPSLLQSIAYPLQKLRLRLRVRMVVQNPHRMLVHVRCPHSTGARLLNTVYLLLLSLDVLQRPLELVNLSLPVIACKQPHISIILLHFDSRGLLGLLLICLRVRHRCEVFILACEGFLCRFRGLGWLRRWHRVAVALALRWILAMRLFFPIDEIRHTTLAQGAAILYEVSWKIF